MSDGKTKNLFKNILFYGAVVIAAGIIGYYLLHSKPAEKEISTQAVVPSTAGGITAASTPDRLPAAIETPVAQRSVDMQQPANSPVKEEETPQPSTKPLSSPAAQPEVATPKPATPKPAAATSEPAVAGVKILKADVTSTVKFYPYTLENTYMEVMAVRASDGTVRTALNTCQVCYDSGRGYYEQMGDYLVCQNCGNRFRIDQVGKVKGGCNPVPVMEEDKNDMGDYILIPQDFLAGKREFFSNWKKK